ncbi:hypothetical protein RM545_17330, partial [Zunongwangia sp. F260]
MQNFTLGKKGKAFSVFTFILLLGMFPSFGQTGDCPNPIDQDPDESGNQQSFCYLSTIADLEATAASGTTIRWYRTAISTTPIPGSELLREETYFAGNADGTCEDRSSVTVSIDDIGAPEPSFGVVFSPCMYSTTGVNTVQELIDLVNPTDGGTDIEVYTQEFSGSPLNPELSLNPGASYFVGQRNAATNCPSSRVAVRYDPIEVQPPSGEAVQTLCEGATVADLEATGINRWYSTENSNPPLNEDTPLVDGESYFATQIINRVNSPEPPCESMARFEVTVVILSAGPDNTDNVLCVSEADSQFNTVENARAYFEGLLMEGVPTGGSFSPSLQSIVDSYDGSADSFQTIYTATFENGCEDDVLLGVEVTEGVNLEDIQITFCTTQLENITNDFGFVLLLIEDLEINIEDFDASGFDQEELANLLDSFDPADPAGTYSVTYTTGAGTACEASSEISITIEEAGPAMAGEFNVPDTCIDGDVINLTDLINPETTTPGGTFSGEGVSTNDDGDFIFDPSLAGADTFTITYEVSAEDLPCITEGDSSDFTIAVSDEESEANVEDINDFPTCTSGDIITLTSFLGANTTPGGTFTVDGTPATTFDPATMGVGTYEVTYTVNGDELECVTGTASTTFEIEVTDEISEAVVQDIADFDTCTQASTITLATLLVGDTTTGGTFTVDGTTATTFDPATMGVGTYEVTYTVNGDELECVTGMDSTTFEIEVTDEVSEAVVEDIADFDTCT